MLGREMKKMNFFLKDGDVVVKDLKEEVVTDIMATIHQMKRGEREDGLFLFIYLLRLLISHATRIFCVHMPQSRK